MSTIAMQGRTPRGGGDGMLHQFYAWGAGSLLSGVASGSGWLYASLQASGLVNAEGIGISIFVAASLMVASFGMGWKAARLAEKAARARAQERDRLQDRFDELKGVMELILDELRKGRNP